jgi:cobalamin biosynthetic protein CobC
MADPIVHGGNLHEASQRYGIPYAQWLDLSTGINPHGYPVPPVPADAWRRLPDEGDGLAACAAHYYGAPDARHVLPVAGSQAAIRALPLLLPRATVAIAPLTYSEYAPAFERAGHRIVPLDIACDALPDDVTHAVLVNPNNPTADHLSAAKLLQWHAQLSARDGTLVVDEAFADAMLEASSLASFADRPRRAAFARQVLWPRWRAGRLRVERTWVARPVARDTRRMDRQRPRTTCSERSLH